MPLPAEEELARAVDFRAARDLPLKTVGELPLQATPAQIEALGFRIRADAQNHPEGAAMALEASKHLAEAQVRRQVVARCPGSTAAVAGAAAAM
ncbi:MAG: hypothetical protein KA105_09815 [Caulobacter sp.]|nr:hypothetical protein [Caulobacter sp.]